MEVKVCAKCDCCWEGVDEYDFKTRETCPECGSTTRKLTAHIEEHARLFDSTGGKIKDPTLPSRKKVRVEFFDGYEWSVAYEKYVRKSMVIDRRENHYHEKVVDPDTGDIIHECTEPLSDHQGHGTAKDKENKN